MEGFIAWGLLAVGVSLVVVAWTFVVEMVRERRENRWKEGE